jgi:hypothetical protein
MTKMYTLPPGAGIQRTMTLLTTSTPRKRNTVRILFYGQSITEQKWWRDVADDLRRRFPNADLVIENRAIGGFAAQFLVKSAEADLYPFYPDLLIFHVYGDHRDYEKIIESVRRRTTAEILMQTDHVTKDEEIGEETDPRKLTPANWSAWMNHVFLPDTARKYGAELADVRAGWKAYLASNKLPASALLSDAVHLNDHGCRVMADLIKPYLRPLPDRREALWKNLVTTYTVGKDVRWKAGRLVLPFEGNRIDVLADAPSPGGASARVRIDGRPPSAFPELYTFTRASVYPGTPWPGVMRVGSEKPLLLEEWTVRIREADDDLKRFTFVVSGSKTGPDGEGASTERFVSRSGRIVLDPSDWGLARSREFTGKALPPGFTITWKVVEQFVDAYTAPAAPDPAREYATTLAQGLSNTGHTLEIRADNRTTVPLRAIRVYRPPLRGGSR